MQAPFAHVSSKNVPLYRRTRSLLALVFGTVILYFLLRPSSPFRSQNTSLDEINGLLYMVAHTEHVLPQELDTTIPVPPSVWVPTEKVNSKVLRKQFEKLNETPIIIFSKTYCPYSRKAKELVARYNLKPVPKVIEVDLRDDANIIKSLLIRLTSRGTFPNVIVRGRSLGGYDNLLEMHETGVLGPELEKAGIEVTGHIHENDI